MLFEAVPAPIEAWRTNPHVEVINITGLDWTGAAFRLEVRDRRDGGQIRATLNEVGSPTTEGVYLSVATVDGVPVSTLSVRFNEATMEAMPAAPEPGDDAELYWGMHITPSGGVKFMAFDGPFTVKASVPA
jgi:hypothetical protein